MADSASDKDRDPSSENPIARRSFLLGAGTAVAAGLTPTAEAQAKTKKAGPEPKAAAAAPPAPEPLLTLTPTEHAFIVAAVDTLIPADELSPSASDCGVAAFVDRQLAGAYGNGARLYRDGPFVKGKPELGYQLALNPREFFRAGIAQTNEWTRKTYGKDFDRLSEADREAALKTMEAGKAEFPGFPLQHVLRRAAADDDGRLLRRSDLWRQPQQGGLEDGRLSGPAGDLSRRVQDLLRQEIRQAAALDRGLYLKQPRSAHDDVLKEVDAVVIGVGWTGSILARELTKAGLKVVGLERGAYRMPREDFTLPAVRDDLKYVQRHELFQDTQLETVTLRHSPRDAALPIRRLGSFLPGTNLGGAGSHWNGNTWRGTPYDHAPRSHNIERYGADAIPDDMPIADYPVSYDELEPYYDKFEKLAGISGKAGNLRGQKIDGGNVFEGPRQNEYPNKPLLQPMAGAIMESACKKPRLPSVPGAGRATRATSIPIPKGSRSGPANIAAIASVSAARPMPRPRPMSACCRRCSPTTNFELRHHAYVKELVYDKQARKVKAVRYVDTRSGEEYEQPAGLVILGAYVFNNVLLMLAAGIGEPYDSRTGKGVVGKNYCYQVTGNNVTVFFEDQEINPFMAAGSHGTVIDDFNGDNFDHGGLGFFGGAYIQAGVSNGRPILTRPVPPGTPRWGRDWKKATAKWYNHAFNISASGCNYAHRENFLDLDPTYKDALGRPLIRMSFNFHEQDYKLGGIYGRRARPHRQGDEPDRDELAGVAAGQLQRRALSVDPQYRRHHHGRRPPVERAQPLSAGLGRRQSVRDGRLGVPAEPELQSDRHGRRARLLVGQCDRHAVPQAPGPAGVRAGLARRSPQGR